MAFRLPLDMDLIPTFCHQWQIAEPAAFGSVLRDDFHEGSDVDLLVTFLPGASWNLLDHVQMQDQLSEFLGRRVDLVSRRASEKSTNWLRRKAILESAETLYAA